MTEENSHEEVAPVDDSAATQNPSTPAQEESTGDTSELEAYKAKLAEVEARNDALSRKLGSIEGMVKKLSKAETPAQEASKKSDAGITAERQELEEFKAEIKREKVLNSLESALTKVGVSRPDKFALMVEQELGSNIKVEGRSVSVQDGLDAVGVLDYIQAYVKTEAGSWMVPSKPAGAQSLTGNSSNEPSRKKVTMDDLNRMSPEELRTGSFDVQD